MGTTDDIQRTLLDAIENIASTYVSRLEVDKTVKATVVKCQDATTGAYNVRYNGGIMRAYVEDSDVSYSPNTLVYVLVPRGDFSERKIIKGRVNTQDIDFVLAASILDGYNRIGSNIVSLVDASLGGQSAGFALHSYRHQERVVLYDRADDSNNKLNIDNETLAVDLLRSDALLLSAEIRTVNLQSKHPSAVVKGNYGIEVEFAFRNPDYNPQLDDPDNEYKKDIYALNTKDMVGNPFIIPSFTEQFQIYPSENKENFAYINKITIFCENFEDPTVSERENEETIWIKNIGIYALQTISDNSDGYRLSLSFPDGSYFKSSDPDTGKKLRVHASFTHNKVDNLSDSTQWYWFKKDPSIKIGDTNYSSLAGAGWFWFNNENATNIFSTNIEDNKAYVNEYRVVGNYKGVVQLRNDFSIVNDKQRRTITITSSRRNRFAFDSNGTVLEVTVISAENQDITNEYQFKWSSMTSNGTEEIPESQFVKPVMQNDRIIYEPADSNDEDYGKYVKYMPPSIYSSVTVKCEVFGDNVYRGSASIILTNERSSFTNQFHIVIDNGNQVFQYNEDGISPAHEMYGPNAQIILPLSATLYDSSNMPVSNAEIRWEIPADNTLLVTNSTAPITTGVNGRDVRVVQGDICNFSINNNYSARANNNQIMCVMTVDDKEYSQATSFFFTKVGENGSNGTDIFCSIGLRLTDGDASILSDPGYLHYVYIKNNTAYWHWKSEDGVIRDTNTAQIELRLTAYRNGVEIDADNMLQTWTLQSKNFKIEKNSTAVPAYNYLAYVPAGVSSDYSPNNLIIKNEIKIPIDNNAQNGYTYNYAYYPFPVVQYTASKPDDYNVEFDPSRTLQEVRYNPDGYNPLYASESGVVLATPALGTPEWATTWSCSGGANENESTASFALGENTSVGDNTNYPYTIVIPHVFYNGEYTNNVVLCSLFAKDGNTQTKIADIRVPIHMYLNRYMLKSLNAWDGNSVVVNEDDEYILAPQIGAGQKDSKNQFTGILMGSRVRRDGNSVQTNVGLFGYKDGLQSIFLDAEDGSAHFGTPNTNPDAPKTSGMVEFYPGNNSQKHSHVGNWYIGQQSLYNISEREYDGTNNNPFNPVSDATALSPYADGTAYNDNTNDAEYHVTGAQIGINPNQTGAILSARPSYLSMKSKALGVKKNGTLETTGITDGIRWSSSKLTPGDSIEVEIDPNKSNVFTIYRHHFDVTDTEDANANLNTFSSTVRQGFFPDALTNMAPTHTLPDTDRYIGAWHRSPIAGINSNGEFYSNAVENGDIKMSLGSIGAFGVNAAANVYTGVRFFKDDDTTIAKLFIPNDSSSKILYLTAGSTTTSEIPLDIDIVGKTVGLFAPNASNDTIEPANMTKWSSLVVSSTSTNISYKSSNTSYGSYVFNNNYTEEISGAHNVSAKAASTININEKRLSVNAGNMYLTSGVRHVNPATYREIITTLCNEADGTEPRIGFEVVGKEQDGYPTQSWMRIGKYQFKFEDYLNKTQWTNNNNLVTHYCGIYYNGNNGFTGLRSIKSIRLQSLSEPIWGGAKGDICLVSYPPSDSVTARHILEDSSTDINPLSGPARGSLNHSDYRVSALYLSASDSMNGSFNLTSALGAIKSYSELPNYKTGNNNLHGIFVTGNLHANDNMSVEKDLYVNGEMYVKKPAIFNDQLTANGAVVANNDWVYTKGVALTDGTADFNQPGHFTLINKAWADSLGGNLQEYADNLVASVQAQLAQIGDVATTGWVDSYYVSKGSVGSELVNYPGVNAGWTVGQTLAWILEHARFN